MINRNKRDTGADYTVVVLEGRLPGDDLNECFKTRCTNKIMLEEITGIKYNRIVYLFAKKHLSYLVENGYMIIRTTTVYKGKQPGGIRNRGIVSRNSY
jgi:hypothetical protein